MFRAAYGLLAPAEQARVRRLLPLYVVTALLEVLAAVSVVPFLALVADPAVAARWSARLPAPFRAMNAAELTTASGLVCLLTLFGANAFFIFAQRRTIRFAAELDAATSSRVLRAIAGRPYAFFLGTNASTLAETALNESWRFVHTVAMPALDLVARLWVVAGIVGLLVFVDPLVSLVVGGLLGGCYLLVYAAVRRRIAAFDAERTGWQSDRWRLATEMLAGIKDLKVGGTTGYYLSEYGRASRAATRLEGRSIHYARLPRYVMETVAFALVVALALVLVRRTDGGSVVPVLGLYAFAGYRLLPALFNCYVQMISIRSNAAATERLAEILTVPPEPDTSGVGPLPLTRALTFMGVGFGYEGAARPVLEGIDLALPAGGRIAIVGATGAGKSTLLDMVLGLLTPTVGRIAVDGRPLDAALLPAWRAAIGYVPQTVFLADDTLAANVALGIAPETVDQARLAAAVRAAALDDLADPGDPAVLGRRIGDRGARLSGGQRQRIGIARALYRGPSLLVLDEATSALDLATERRVLDGLAALPGPVTLVAVTHRLEAIRDFDLIVVLRGGRVAGHGRFAELASSCAPFRELLAAGREERPGEPATPASPPASP